MQNTTQTSLNELAREAAEAKGVGFVSCEVKKAGGRDVVVVTIQKEGGVGVDDCAHVSKELDVLLEAEGLFKGAFTLEVSSPGLTRALQTEKDFKENVGNDIKVKYVNEQNKVISTMGRLESVNEFEVTLNSKEGSLGIQLESIKSARLEITI